MNIAHTDGGLRKDFACAAAVLQTENGTVHERHQLLMGAWTNNYAEYAGVILALKMALELQLDNLRIHTDSLLIANQLSGFFKVKNSGLRPLFSEALRLGTLLGEVSIRHVPRERNTYPDLICNVELDRIVGRNFSRWEKRLEFARLHPPSGVPNLSSAA